MDFTECLCCVFLAKDITSVKGEDDTEQKLIDYENKISELEQQVAELKMTLTKERYMNAILEKHKVSYCQLLMSSLRKV